MTKSSSLQTWCTFLSICHLLAISLATFVASLVIESILVSGLICMIIALIAFVSSLFSKRYWLTVISLCTIGVGVFFIVYELTFRGFGGPMNAALPLCILFLFVQAFAIIATVADINQRRGSESWLATQVSFKQLLIASALFSLSFAVIENFPTKLVPSISNWSVAFRYPWLVALSLAMFFLSTFGLISLWISKHNSNAKTSR